MGIALYIAQGVVTSAITGLVLMGLYMLCVQSRPSALSPVSGRIMLNRWVTGGIALFCLCFSAIGFYGALYHDGGIAAYAVGIGCALIGYCAGAHMHPAYAASWTATEISGPASYGIWPFGPKRATIRFSEIEAVGRDWADSWYVEDARGTRIRWSYYYGGFGHLMNAVEAACPHLFGTAAD